jgi:chemotaxis protein methyltransferase CheR
VSQAQRKSWKGAASENLAPGEFTMNREDFSRISSMIYSDAGIYLPETKAALVYARLAKRLRALKLEAFQDYCNLVESPAGAQERNEMLAALTTNVTRFYREPHHFEHLKTQLLPTLIREAQRGGRVRIWSAACSSGQEPYSAALTILSLWPEAASSDVRVLATDIDPHILEAGVKGLYSESQIENVPLDQRKRFFENVTVDGKPHWKVGSALRNLVSFRQLNLIEAWPMSGTFDAIFCRNVVIYFDEPTQQRIWANFVPRLAPRGALYIGHSERVTGAAAQALVSDGVSTYRHKGAQSR